MKDNIVYLCLCYINSAYQVIVEVLLDILIDTKGLACPMPIIKLKKSLAENPELDNLFYIESTDKGGLQDIPAFCQQQCLVYELLEEQPCIIFKVWRST
ncbi:MAG: tRNA 2-thiouridine synthesizing protein A [Thiomicrorhabdus sp.]|nr:MAG: tRNA 2-thiouridine synthesizing protein A [Thiomicrorhabdus sp.]